MHFLNPRYVYIINMTETFQFIVPSELNILIFVHYLQLFLRKRGVRGNSSYTNYHCSYSISSIFKVWLHFVPNAHLWLSHFYHQYSKGYRRPKRIHYIFQEFVFQRLYLNNSHTDPLIWFHLSKCRGADFINSYFSWVNYFWIPHQLTTLYTFVIEN